MRRHSRIMFTISSSLFIWKIVQCILAALKYIQSPVNSEYYILRARSFVHVLWNTFPSQKLGLLMKAFRDWFRNSCQDCTLPAACTCDRKSNGMKREHDKQPCSGSGGGHERLPLRRAGGRNGKGSFTTAMADSVTRAEVPGSTAVGVTVGAAWLCM